MEPSTAGSQTHSEKEEYARPELVTIELKAEQVLSTGCKSQPSPTNNSGVPDCGILAGCNTTGS